MCVRDTERERERDVLQTQIISYPGTQVINAYVPTYCCASQVWQTAPSTAAAITCGGTEAQHPELDSILDEGELWISSECITRACPGLTI